jgi:hypothetical protein
MRAAMGLTRRIAEEFRDLGTYSRMLDGPVTYPEANELMQTVARAHGLRNPKAS